MLEKTITNKIIKRLNEDPHLFVWKRHSGQFDNLNGYPDIEGVYSLPITHDPDQEPYLIAIRVEIEMKKPGEKPRKLQKSRLRKLKRVGCISGWATSVSEARKLIDEQVAFIKEKIDQSYEETEDQKQTKHKLSA